MMTLMHGGETKRRWWHRLPFLGPKTYTHSFESQIDQIDSSGLARGDEVKSIGGQWHGEGGCDYVVPNKQEAAEAMEVGERFLYAFKVMHEFDKAMQAVSVAVNTDAAQIERMKRQIINRAIDNEVLELYRYMRVAAGRTDHKKLYKQERFQLNIERIYRAARKSGVELGWLFGLGVRWNWKYVRPEHRIYDWEFDCRW